LIVILRILGGTINLLLRTVMNRNYFFLIALVFMCLNAEVRGQASSYSMTPSIGAYTPVTGGTRITAVEQDFGISGPITIPFSFVFEGIAYTQCKVTSDGYLTFNATGATFSNGFGDLDNGAANQRPLLAPLWDDMDGSAPAPNDSKFEHVTTGTVGSRVMTFEWLNWEWNWNASTDVISFQVKLYEGTNVIDFVYRQESGAVSGGSASIGLSGLASFLSLQSTSTSPLTSSIFENDNLSTRPATGQVYKFTPPTCPAPNGLKQTNGTASTVDLSWNTGGATDWQVDYGTIGHLPGTGTIMTTASATASISGLTGATCYDVFVRDSCAPGDVSNWVGPVQMCTAWMAPYFENYDNNVPLTFTNQSNYTFVNGWSGISNSTGGSTWNWIPSNNIQGPGQDHTTGSGIFMMGYNFSGTTGDSAWLYSPYIDLSAMTNPTIRLWYHKNSTSATNIADIIIEADTNGSGNWILIDDTTMIGNTHSAPAVSDPWDELLVSLSGFNGTARYRISTIKQFCCDHGGVDDFEIFDLLDDDAKVVKIDEPVDGGCAGSKPLTITFQNNGQDPITSLSVGYSVNGGAPVTETVTAAIPSFATYTYTFNSMPVLPAGNVGIAVWTNLTGDGFTGNDTLMDTVIISPVLSDYFYCEGFESGNGGWTTGGDANSWEIGVPAGTFVSAAANGTMAAMTNLTGAYNNSENSFLLSPCFDFSEFENDPVLQFSHIFDIESCCDETWVEMSVNGGLTWLKLGQSGSGTNWYNDAGNQWWDGTSGGSGVWRDASIEMTGAAGASDVKIRFFFSTDGSVTRDGIGVDDVAIVVPANDLFGDTVSTCNDPNFVLDASGIYPDTVVTYAWSTGDTTPTINVTTPGSYTVTITDTKIGVVSTETIEVIAQAAPTVAFATPIDTIDFNGLAMVIQLSPALPLTYDYTWTSGSSVTNYPFFVADPVALGVGMHTITLEVVDNVGCTGIGQHNVFVSNFVGLNTLGESKIEYFPNPAKDELTINLAGHTALGVVNLTVLDYNGRAVLKEQLNDRTGSMQHTVNVENIASGMYFIQLESKAGVANLKLIIE
jgi:hypothetical protein